MHAPETWGFVQFSETIVGQGTADFIASPDEEIKWALRQLYYQQRAFHEKNKKYTGDLNAFTLPEFLLEGYRFEPKIFLTNQGYEIVAAGADSQFQWLIREDGRTLRIEKTN